jgi:hypothetical protein
MKLGYVGFDRYNPNNELWEKMDYSFPINENIVLEIINSGKASPATLQRIVSTVRTDMVLLHVCRQKLIQVEDILKALERFAEEPILSYKQSVYNSIVDILFDRNGMYSKYNDFATYVKTNYDVNIETMPAGLVKQMLQIEEMQVS